MEGVDEAYVHTLSCMHAHMLAGLLSGPLGHLAACLERGSNMRGHIKGSLSVWLPGVPAEHSAMEEVPTKSKASGLSFMSANVFLPIITAP